MAGNLNYIYEHIILKMIFYLYTNIDPLFIHYMEVHTIRMHDGFIDIRLAITKLT